MGDKTAWQAVKEVFGSPVYWGGFVKAAVIPPLKAMAASTDATWDDSLVKAGEEFLDKLFPAA